MSRFLPLLLLALLPIACTSQPSESASSEEEPTEYETVTTETMTIETVEVVSEGQDLPQAKFSDAVIYVEAPNIKGTTQLGNGSTQTAQFGSGDFVYSVHLEYLGHGETGDLYGYSIYVPIPENAKDSLSLQEEQFAGEVEFVGEALVLAEDEEAKAVYKLLPKAPDLK